MVDKYGNYAELSYSEKEGQDYQIKVVNRNSLGTIIAPHGGSIEPRTSEIAEAIAGKEFNLYCFVGIKLNNNYSSLHIASHRFDEPKCLDLLSHSRQVVAIHGCKGNDKEIYAGGLDAELKSRIVNELLDAGFKIIENSHEFNATDPMNICNRGSKKIGVQLEFTRRLRDNMNIEMVAAPIRAVLKSV